MLLPWICLFGVFISHSGASVSLVTDGGMTSFQDGTDVILICTISPYNNVMTWLVDNDPYANCFLGSCGPSSNKPYTFIFNFDESTGIFRLTIESVNSTHAGLIFACDDGNERKTITFDVTTGVGQSETSDGFCSTMDSDCKGFIIGACLIVSCAWLIGVIICCKKCSNARMSMKDYCIYGLLCISIIGVLVMLFLDYIRCNLDPPNPPNDFTVAENGITYNSITVQWTGQLDEGCKQTFYVYVNGKKRKVDSTCEHENIWSYTCEDLEPDANHRIKIKAGNCMGSSKHRLLECRTNGALDITQFGGLVG